MAEPEIRQALVFCAPHNSILLDYTYLANGLWTSDDNKIDHGPGQQQDKQ